MNQIVIKISTKPGIASQNPFSDEYIFDMTMSRLIAILFLSSNHIWFIITGYENTQQNSLHAYLDT